MELMKRIQQTASMLIWSQDAQGMIKMSDVPRKTVFRSKSVMPSRRKASIQLRSLSLPIECFSSSGDSSLNLTNNIEEDFCYDIYPLSNIKVRSKDEDDEYVCSSL